MSIVSFKDDNFELAESFITKSYLALGEKLNSEKDKISYYIEDKDTLLGYDIKSNIPLSKLYGRNFYVVRFVFVNIDTLHKAEQCEKMKALLMVLKEEMNRNNGYYNLRIPSHVIDLLKALNEVMDRGYFCGGTVEEVIMGKKAEYHPQEGLLVDWADEEYIQKYQDQLMELTFASFESYQGQYHISPVTSQKAGRIYEDWIRDNFIQGGGIIAATYHNSPIGFVTITEKENAVEGVLSAVDAKYRKLGAYRAMISFLVNYAYENNKSFVTSTQFDNYIVQGVWNSIGLKPFYSIYNFHIDTALQ